MGFALWVDGELSWAQGTHEYRPMGVAVISSTDQFRTRDFRPQRKIPHGGRTQFAGFFASIGHLNRYLLQRRRKKLRAGKGSKAQSVAAPFYVPPPGGGRGGP